MPTTSTGQGRRMTAVESRYQKPWSATSVLLRSTRKRLTRVPSTASRAGSTTTAAITASATVAMPA